MSRRTRARRWRSTHGARGWKTAGLATNSLLVYFKNVVTAFEKRFKQLGGKIVDKETLRDRPEQRRDRGQPPSLAQGGGLRHLDRVQRAPRLRLRDQGAAQQHADPQLLGGRRHLLGDEQPEGDELLHRHVCVRVRRRPEQGDQEADLVDEGGGGGSRDRRLPRRRSDDRRALRRDQPGARLAQRRGARQPAGQVPQRQGAGRQDQLLVQAAHRPWTPIPRACGSRTTRRSGSAS